MKSKKINVEMINDLINILPKEITKEDSERLQDTINYLDQADSKKREKIYSYFITSIVQYFLGVDDELQKIKIYGKNDKGEPYIITLR
jgi:molecular chaperone GrpE (heat shock protein)